MRRERHQPSRVGTEQRIVDDKQPASLAPDQSRECRIEIAFAAHLEKMDLLTHDLRSVAQVLGPERCIQIARVNERAKVEDTGN